MLWFWQGKALAKIPYVFSELQLRQFSFESNHGNRKLFQYGVLKGVRKSYTNISIEWVIFILGSIVFEIQ